MGIETGAPAPDIRLPAWANGAATELALADYRRGSGTAAAGTSLVLYFYPKDSTPGCTTESQDFRDLYEQLRTHGAEVIGISRDSLASHQKFAERHSLPFPLLCDGDEIACRAFDVIREKNMYGRKVMGIERSTFLIDADGVVREIWRKVKVKGHAHAVFERLQTLD